MNKRFVLLVCGLLVFGFSSFAQATEFSGTAKVGYVITDEEGSAAVNEPTFNLFEGPSFSLERFNIKFDSGLKMYGDLKNVTLNNRNLKFGMTRTGKFGVTFTNYQYRHYYSDNGLDFTRRRNWNGQLWYEVADGLRLFGGYGQTLKKGMADELIEPAGLVARHEVDYTQGMGNFGFTYKRDRHFFKGEYRFSKYEDNLMTNYDRTTERFRFSGSAPVPSVKNLFVNAGYQHYTARIETRNDSLFTNAFWGGAQWYRTNSCSIKYSFLFDRSRRTSDIVATDNILHALYLTRAWMNEGGFTLGYRYQTTDDYWDEISQNGYFTSAWYMVMPELKLKAGWGTEQSSIEDGRTLEGEKSRTKFWAGLNYKRGQAGWNLMFRNRSTDNDMYSGWGEGLLTHPGGISYSTDYSEIATDLYCVNQYGTVSVGYSYSDGDYTNDSGVFKYREHVITGDVETRSFGPVSFKAGATYLRGKEDLDYERSTLRFGGDWLFRPGHHLEVEYDVYNFDNYIVDTPVYTEYYTGNIVRINLVKEL
jgi:hypothetical protein